jgi:hypothetical protein
VSSRDNGKKEVDDIINFLKEFYLHGKDKIEE